MAILAVPGLRCVPMYDDGYIHFTSLFLMAEEVWDVRVIAAHGAIYSKLSHAGSVEAYKFVKYKKEGKNGVVEETHHVGVGVLERVSEHADVLSTLIRTYVSVLKAEIDVEAEEKLQRRVRDNRKFLASIGLLPTGMTVDMNEITITLPIAQKGKGATE